MSIYEALLEVQKELKPVKKTSDNPFFHSKYADLEAVVEAVMPILSKNGIVAVQTTRWTEKGPALYTKLVDVKTGEAVESEFPIISKDDNDPQKVIAGLTYMRRASLTTICGLATQDDDGNKASGNDKPPVREFKKPLPLKRPEESTYEKKPDESEYQKGANAKFTPKSVVFDSGQKEFKYKIVTEKSGDFYTDKEVLAKLAKSGIGKTMDVRMTVDSEFRNILLDIIPF